MEFPTVPIVADANQSPSASKTCSQEANVLWSVRVKKTRMNMSTKQDFWKQRGIFQKDLCAIQELEPRAWCILGRCLTVEPHPLS